MNQPPSTEWRFQSTLKFDPLTSDDGHRANPLLRECFAAPLSFVTPRLSNRMMNLSILAVRSYISAAQWRRRWR